MKSKEIIKELAVKINPELYFKLKELSVLEGTKIKYLIDKAVRSYLRRRNLLKE